MPLSQPFVWRGAGDSGGAATKDVIIYVSPTGNDNASGNINAPIKTIREALNRVPCCWTKKMRIRLLGENVVFDESAAPLNIALGMPVGPNSEPLAIEGQQAQTKDLTGAAGWQASYTAAAPGVVLTGTLSAPVLAGASVVPVSTVLPPSWVIAQPIYPYQIQIGTEPTVYDVSENTASTITFAGNLVNGYPAGTPFKLNVSPFVSVTLNIPAAVPSFTGVDLCEVGAAGTGMRMGGDLMGSFVMQPDFFRQPIVAHTSHTQGVANQVVFVVANFLSGYSTGDAFTLTKPPAKIIFGTGTMSNGTVILSNVDMNTNNQFDCGYTDEGIGSVNIICAGSWFTGPGNRGFVFNNTTLQAGQFLGGFFGDNDGPACVPADIIPAGIHVQDVNMFIEKGSQVLVSDGSSKNATWLPGAIGGDVNVLLYANGTKDTSVFASRAVVENFFVMMDGGSFNGARQCAMSAAFTQIKNSPGDAFSVDSLSSFLGLGLTGNGNAGVGLNLNVNGQGRAVVNDDVGDFTETAVSGAGGDVLIGVDSKTWTFLRGVEKGWTEIVAQGADNVPTGNIVRMSNTLFF